MNMIFVSIIASVLFLILDLIWISLNKQSYSNMYLKVTNQSTKINSCFAIIAYIIMVLSVFIFVVPGMHISVVVHDESLFWSAVKHGLIFGFIIYGVYNFTNLATLYNWKLEVAFKDMVWGSTLYFFVAFVSGFLFKYIV